MFAELEKAARTVTRNTPAVVALLRRYVETQERIANSLEAIAKVKEKGA